MRGALDFAPLINKVARLERPASLQELEAGAPPTVGGEGVVCEVRDVSLDGRRGVEVMFDYGMSITVFNDEVDWSFVVRSHYFDAEEKRREAKAAKAAEEALDDGSDLL